jgi:hypothetical protein
MGNRMHLIASDTTELLDLYLDRSVPENHTVDALIGPSETSVFYHKLIYLLVSLEDDTSTPLGTETSNVQQVIWLEDRT